MCQKRGALGRALPPPSPALYEHISFQARGWRNKTETLSVMRPAGGEARRLRGRARRPRRGRGPCRAHAPRLSPPACSARRARGLAGLRVRERGSFPSRSLVRGSSSPSPSWPLALLASFAEGTAEHTHHRHRRLALCCLRTPLRVRAAGPRDLPRALFQTAFGSDRLPRVFIYLSAPLFVYLPVYFLRPLTDCCELADFVVVVVAGVFLSFFFFFFLFPPSILFPALPPTPRKLFVFPGVSKHCRGGREEHVLPGWRRGPCSAAGSH